METITSRRQLLIANKHPECSPHDMTIEFFPNIRSGCMHEANGKCIKLALIYQDSIWENGVEDLLNRPPSTVVRFHIVYHSENRCAFFYRTVRNVKKGSRF